MKGSRPGTKTTIISGLQKKQQNKKTKIQKKKQQQQQPRNTLKNIYFDLSIKHHVMLFKVSF